MGPYSFASRPLRGRHSIDLSVDLLLQDRRRLEHYDAAVLCAAETIQQSAVRTNCDIGTYAAASENSGAHDFR